MIDLVTLKQEIEQNKFNGKLLICQCADDTAKFVASQYLHYYARKNNFELQEREDIITPHACLDWLQEPSIVYYHHIDELSFEPLKEDNIWIICSKVRSKIAKEYDDYIVKIPKLEQWQIKDYITSICPLTDSQADVLMQVYTDITKLDIEIKKLTIFRQNLYNDLVDQLIYNEQTPIFDLVNALIQRNKKSLSDFIKSETDVDPFPFMALLIKNLKAVIDIQLAKNPTAESVGMSGKQFWAVSKYSCGHYNRDELLYLYDLLTDLDSKIKEGNLDTSNVVNYIIGKFLNLMR